MGRFADKANAFAERTNAATAATNTTGGNFVKGVKGAVGAAGNAARAAMSSTPARLVGGAFSLGAATNAAYDLNKAWDAGDGAAGIDAGLRLGAGAAGVLSTFAPIAGHAGLAYGAGHLVGDQIYKRGLTDNGVVEDRSFADKLGGTINQAVRNLSGGRWGTDDSAKLMLEAERFGPTPAPTSQPATQAPPSARPAAPLQPQAQAQPLTAQPQSTPAEGVITVKNGNEFSGENVREGFRYDGAPRAGLTSMPADNFASVSPALDRQRAEAMAQLTPAQAAAALGDPGYSRGATPGMGGFGGATLSSAANERFNYAGLPEREKDRQAALRTAQMQADAQRYGVDAQVQSGLRSDATARRGQDLDLMGRETVARASLRSSERAAEKDAFDREIKLAEFRANRGDKAFEQKQTRETNLQRNIEAANTTMVDGKPVVNAAAAAEYRRGIDRSVARLGLDGVDKLSPRAEQQLFAASDLLRTMRENASWVPWAPDALKTVDPLDLTDLYVAKNGDRVITREGRAKGQTIPARFFDTEEGNRIRMFGTPTNKYDLLASQTGN